MNPVRWRLGACLAVELEHEGRRFCVVLEKAAPHAVLGVDCDPEFDAQLAEAATTIALRTARLLPLDTATGFWTPFAPPLGWRNP